MYNVRIKLINILWPWASVNECILKAERKHQHLRLVDQILISVSWCQKGGVVWWDLRQMDFKLRPQLPLIARRFFFFWAQKKIACHSSLCLPCLSSSPVVRWTSATMTVQGWNPVLLVISLGLNFGSAGELPPKFWERESFCSSFLHD